jgi:hypothetical protein
VTSDNLYHLLGGSTPENNLAEEYARVVDHIGRLAGAVEDGNLYYAWEKAGELRGRLEAFERRLQQEITEDGETFRRFTGRDLDGQKVADAAVAFSIAFGHRAGKLLHSTEQIKDDAVRAEVEANNARNRAFREQMGA